MRVCIPAAHEKISEALTLALALGTRASIGLVLALVLAPAFARGFKPMERTIIGYRKALRHCNDSKSSIFDVNDIYLMLFYNN